MPWPHQGTQQSGRGALGSILRGGCPPSAVRLRLSAFGSAQHIPLPGTPSSHWFHAAEMRGLPNRAAAHRRWLIALCFPLTKSSHPLRARLVTRPSSRRPKRRKRRCAVACSIHVLSARARLAWRMRLIVLRSRWRWWQKSCQEPRALTWPRSIRRRPKRRARRLSCAASDQLLKARLACRMNTRPSILVARRRWSLWLWVKPRHASSGGKRISRRLRRMSPARVRGAWSRRKRARMRKRRRHEAGGARGARVRYQKRARARTHRWSSSRSASSASGSGWPQSP
jgi:hypothetical protein